MSVWETSNEWNRMALRLSQMEPQGSTMIFHPSRQNTGPVEWLLLLWGKHILGSCKSWLREAMLMLELLEPLQHPWSMRPGTTFHLLISSGYKINQSRSDKFAKSSSEQILRWCWRLIQVIAYIWANQRLWRTLSGRLLVKWFNAKAWIVALCAILHLCHKSCGNTLPQSRNSSRQISSDVPC